MLNYVLIVALLMVSVGGTAFAQTQQSVLRLDHVGIHVADLDRSVAFYTKVLGLKETPAPFPRDAARWIDLGAGRKLHIVAGGPASVVRDKWDHFALATSDLDGMIAVLDRMHVRWSDMEHDQRAIQTRPDGIRQIFVRDPDGYVIEVNDGDRRHDGRD